MKLEFRSKQIRCLKQIANEIVHQEECVELVVPDSFPDVGIVVDSHAIPIVRGKECRDGVAAISGGIKCGVMYRSEDGTCWRNLETYVPFACKLEANGLDERSKVFCAVKIRSVDGRMINSRKMMLRINLACSVCAMEDYLDELYDLPDVPADLQLKTSEYECTLPAEYSEKTFTISDSGSIPMNSPPIEQIIRASCYFELQDQKIIANKGVFKGTVRCIILYRSDDDNVYACEQYIPFSQFCELDRDYEDDLISVVPVVTGYEVERDPQDPMHRMIVSIHALAQCLISEKHKIKLIEDAYSTGRSFQPEWKNFALPCCIDQQRVISVGQSHGSGNLRSIVASEVYMDFPFTERRDEHQHTEVELFVHVLGYDQHHVLSCVRCKLNIEQDMLLASCARCHFDVHLSGPCNIQLVPDGIEVRCEIMLENTCFCDQDMKMLCGGELEECVERTSRPSIVLRRVSPGTRIWDISKEYGAREGAVRLVNSLEHDQILSERMILIPIGGL